MKNYASEYCGETSLQIRKDCSRGKGNTFLLSIVLIGLGHHFQQLFSVLFPPPRRSPRRREDGEAVGLCFALAALRGHGSSVSCRLGGREGSQETAPVASLAWAESRRRVGWVLLCWSTVRVVRAIRAVVRPHAFRSLEGHR